MLIYSTDSLQYTPRNNLNCPFVTILRRYHCFKNTARHSFRIHEDPFENRRYPETIDSATTIITVHHHNNREGMWSRRCDHMVCVGEKEGMKTSRHESDTASEGFSSVWVHISVINRYHLLHLQLFTMIHAVLKVRLAMLIGQVFPTVSDSRPSDKRISHLARV